MDPIETLLAIEGVKRCKAEYFRCIDEKDWDGLTANFTADAETDMRESVEPHNPELLHRDPRLFTATNRRFLDASVRTAHFGYMPRIEVLAPDAAEAIWSMEDWLWIGAGNPLLPAGRMHGWGHYHDRYTRVGDRWLISATRLTRIKIEWRA